MIDAGRVPESMDYYRRVVEFCAEWQFNTLQFRLADDQGSALRFTSVHGLVTHQNAFTADQLRSLAEFAQTHGIDVIPELESFGHTGFITRSARYAHLLDSDVRGDAEFSGISPVQPESLELFSKLYREVAAIFPSRYFHGGCDEVNWGGSIASREALAKKSRARIWADYLNVLNQTARDLGKEFIVWGDFVLHKQPDILGLLSKDIILMDWNYADKDPQKLARTLQVVLDNGSRCIGAPALSCYRWGARIGTDQLRNVEAFADSYLDNASPNTLGVMVTNWIPSRYLQNSIWDGFAYSAVALKDGSAVARAEGHRRFVERHYGAAWNDQWQQAFQMIYDAAPPLSGDVSSKVFVPWSSEGQLAAVVKLKPAHSNAFADIRDLLTMVRSQVKKNEADFASFQLCVEYQASTVKRNTLIVEALAKPSANAESDTKLIQMIAASDQALAHRLESDWDHGRPAHAPATSELLFGLQPKDQLLFHWKQAAAYSALLAAHPQQFRQLLNAGLSES